MTEENGILNFEQISSEAVLPFYHNGALIEPPFKLFRINKAGGRIYFRFQDEEKYQNPILYMGTGSITGEIPMAKFLQKYREGLGTIAADKELYMWSLYGSFSDSRIAEFVTSGHFDGGLSALPERLKDYLYNQRFWVEDWEFALLSKSIKKDMIGFERFIYDRKVEFVFIEYPVVSELDGTATPIDMGIFFDREVDAAESLKKDGTPKKYADKVVERCFGLFNYKSGKIYRNHGIQCLAERNMFMESYPEFTTMPIRSFNLTIRDYHSMNWDEYRGTSDKQKPYQIKDWTDDVNQDDYRDYLSLAKRHRETMLLKPITLMEGDMQIGDKPEQYIITKTIRQIIEDGSWVRYQKSNAGIPEAYISQT